MRVALYARVSTEDQDPEVQLAALRAHVANRGWQVVEEFVDRGYSGAMERRPALDRLMRAVWAGQFQAVLVWRFDRFARSVKHLVTALETFRGLNVAFISLQELLDTSSPIGQAMFTIIGAMAQLERDIIRERVVAGLERARARGQKLGRPRVSVDAARLAPFKGTASRWARSRADSDAAGRRSGAACGRRARPLSMRAEAAYPPDSETPAKKPKVSNDAPGWSS